jgi:dienelactone hydrolase
MQGTDTGRCFAVAGLVIAIILGATSAGRADTRVDFLKLIDRPRVPLAAQEAADRMSGGPWIEWFSYATEAGQRVPGLLVKANGNSRGRQPVVIALHGTGGSKSSELGFLKAVAAKGFIGVAIDGRYHGDRAPSHAGAKDYEDAILRAYRTGKEHPFFFDTAWDVMRLIDYLETRDDVDAKRIGLYGVSKGGIETYLSAAVDPRIAAAVPCIGMESFAWADDNDSWHSRIGTIQHAFDAAAKDAGVDKPDGKFVHDFYARIAPGIDGEFDGPEMIKLIAPRPLMLINGDSDPRTPLSGLKLCIDAGKAAYSAAGADKNLVIVIQNHTGHKVNLDSELGAIDWLAEQLNSKEPR